MRCRRPILELLCCAAALAPRTAAAAWTTEDIAGTSVDVYVPASPRALLVGLHGCTQSPDHLRDRGHFEQAAETNRAVIALPAVPDGGVIAGCWDYYGDTHSRTELGHRTLLELVQHFLSDASLAIDPNRVYVIGISSGGGETAVIGCLAPDVFAGIGIVAGPAVGTGLIGAGSVSTDRDTAASVCNSFAEGNQTQFSTQLTSVIHGADDFVVDVDYARLNAEIMAEVYRGEGVAFVESNLDVTTLPGTSPTGQGAIWSDDRGPRVSMIIVDGMGHAFPAGEGDGQETNFVAQKGVQYPSYVLDFFETNNRRLDRPIVPDAGVSADGSSSDAKTSDAGAIEEEDDAGCSCSEQGGGLSSLAWLLLALLGVFVLRNMTDLDS